MIDIDIERIRVELVDAYPGCSIKVAEDQFRLTP
jgi:hypothetical protein